MRQLAGAGALFNVGIRLQGRWSGVDPWLHPAAGLAIVDFFRLTAGKIVEHWEFRQPVAESTLHTNSML